MSPQQEAFERFHVANPQVYQLFRRFTLEAVNAGRKRFSARTVLHRIRWYTAVETADPSGFKVNDHWSPFYARMFIEDHPHLEGLFVTRTAYAD